MIDEDILNIATKAWKKKRLQCPTGFLPTSSVWIYNYLLEPEKEAFTKRCRDFAG